MKSAMDHSERDRDYHDVVAGQYDRVAVRPREFPITLLFEGFGDRFARRDRLLDLGCGTGHMLVRYAGAFRAALGVDHSAGMLREAQANLARHGLAHVLLHRSDLFAFCAQAISVFDAITCVGVMHHLTATGRPQLLDGMAKLCAAHGRVLLAEPVIFGPPPPAILDWNSRALGASRAFEGPLPPDPDEAPLDEAAWRADIERAGFDILAENRMWELSTSREFPSAQEREALRALVAQHPGGNVLALMLARR